MSKEKNRSIKSGTLLLFCFLGLVLIYFGFNDISIGRGEGVRHGRSSFITQDAPSELVFGILILIFCFLTWRYSKKKSNEVSDRHKKILAQRKKDIEKGKTKFYDWDDIKDEIKKVE